MGRSERSAAARVDGDRQSDLLRSRPRRPDADGPLLPRRSRRPRRSAAAAGMRAALARPSAQTHEHVHLTLLVGLHAQKAYLRELSTGTLIMTDTKSL